jgi:tetratricopeptide (TPR) repeat protein
VAAVRAEALRLLGRVEEELGRFDAAARFLQAALAHDPGDHATLVALADLHLARLDDRARARQYYSEALGRLPDGERASSHVYFNLALLVGESDPERALELFAQARASGHPGTDVDRETGYLQARLGEWEAALAAFQAYLASDAPAGERAAVRVPSAEPR